MTAAAEHRRDRLHIDSRFRAHRYARRFVIDLFQKRRHDDAIDRAYLDKYNSTGALKYAKDLGCPPTSAFWKITFPLSLPGVIAGCLLVFIPAVGEFVIPDLLGGSQTLMIGKTLWNEFFANRDWPVSSAVAVILLLLLTVPIMLFQQAQARAQEEGK